MKHDHRQARSRVVDQIIKSTFKDVSRRYRPKDIVNDMRKNYGVNIRYEKAWRARERALELLMGSPKKSYTLLRKYGEALKSVNPGTVFSLKLEDNKYFQYAFMALGCSIQGFRSCIRTVLVIDGAHLKGKYKGVILIASSVDGNNQLYPLAFGIVDRETNESWTWFLERVKSCIGDVEGLVFVPHRHRTINNFVTSVFPTAEHVSCMHHVQMNLNDKFKIRSEGVEWLYLLAAKAFKKSTFRYYWNPLAGFPELRQYLEELGFDKWSRAYQPGLRYNQMTTNIADFMNAVLVHARYLPVTALLEHCRALLQRWYYERQTYASTRASILTDYAEGIVKSAVE
ncbi:protein FAR-RED ELONGATED HYPOCOTYL 3-like [Momordica charantia]|uniref:Protein FAR-RED ELONGATED HYPOCOTYL 3-like n=1 Tax=Momordica charantia TaxID=3673 RepID=A0A6J1DVR6_MOMCH|nr:protein FAR-RED ELONGATED HYPOCOTYL 3-like [Momordica charantia]